MNNVFDELLSLAEAAKIWHLEESTLRKAISSKRLIVGQDVKKFGKQWVIKKESMEKIYGYLYNDLINEEEISESKKRQIYFFINECFILYCKKYKLNFSTSNKQFEKYGIIDYLYECYDYLHLQDTNSTVIDIRSRIRRGVCYTEKNQ